MVELAHQGSSPRCGTDARIFLDIFQNLTVAILTVVGDVLVDSKAPVVILSISRICRLSLLEVLIEVGLRVCIHRNKCVCVLYCVSQKKYDGEINSGATVLHITSGCEIA